MAWEEVLTWDSKWEGEYQESKQKSVVPKRQEPSLGAPDDWLYPPRRVDFPRDQHVTRLREASRYFAYPYDESKFWKNFKKNSAHLDLNLDYRCRIALQKTGPST